MRNIYTERLEELEALYRAYEGAFPEHRGKKIVEYMGRIKEQIELRKRPITPERKPE